MGCVYSDMHKCDAQPFESKPFLHIGTFFSSLLQWYFLAIQMNNSTPKLTFSVIFRYKHVLKIDCKTGIMKLIHINLLVIPNIVTFSLYNYIIG